MVLYLNTTYDNTLILGIGKKLNVSPDIVETYRFSSQKNHYVLWYLDRFLTKHHFTLSSFVTIVVCVGEGRFSALRVGITISNTLGAVLHIPVYGIRRTDWEKNHFQKNNFILPIPYYNKEPNLTFSKK